MVYIKATEGTGYVNSLLKTQYQEARAAGLLVGFYHFFRAKNESNARQQAQYFVNTVKGMEYGCCPALDIETAEDLDKATLSCLAKTFLEQVKTLTGIAPVIYTYTSFISESLDSTLAAYPLWIADYRKGAPGTNPVWKSWVGWQYSDKGSVSGISGNVDLDIFNEEVRTVPDVPAWKKEAMDWLLKKGYITQEHDPLESWDAATMAAVLKNLVQDETLDDWAKESWEKAVARGIVDGTMPRGLVTREMLIMILDRLGLL